MAPMCLWMILLFPVNAVMPDSWAYLCYNLGVKVGGADFFKIGLIQQYC